jgi:hypothetical protein
MSRPFSMCTFLASRFLRALALCAWMTLLVVSSPASAAAIAGNAPDGQVHVATSVMMDHDMVHDAPATGQHPDDCCGTPAHPGHLVCHCDATCGNALHPALPTWGRAALLAARYAAFHGEDAPTPSLMPPLRPPAA